MSAVGHLVERRFLPNLIKGVDIVIDRNVETVCIVVSVGHAGNHTVFLLVNPYKST